MAASVTPATGDSLAQEFCDPAGRLSVSGERADGTTRIDVADAGPPIPDTGRSISVDEAARTPL